MKERTRQRFAALLLLLFVAFAAGRTLFVHTHVGPAGMVTHSHPYLPSGQHTHSAAQFESLAVAGGLSFDGGCAGADVPSPAECCNVQYECRTAAAAVAAAAGVAALRAPPALL